MSTFYVLGPMSGMPDNNAREFKRAAAILRGLGDEVVSPLELDEAEGLNAEREMTPEEYTRVLARDLEKLAGAVARGELDGGVALEGWEASRGAVGEVHTLRSLGKPILVITDTNSGIALRPVPEAHIVSTLTRFVVDFHSFSPIMVSEWKNTAEGAKNQSPSPSSTLTIAQETGGASDARSVTKPATALGSEPISKRSTATTSVGIENQKPDSSDTESREPTTNGCSLNSETCAPSAAGSKPLSCEGDCDRCTSTTTNAPEPYGDFSALRVIPGSGNSTTFRLEWNVPSNTLHDSSKRFYTILASLAELHARKQQDYGRANDPFANVRASSDWGVPEWVGAMVRATDKVRRLQTYALRGTLANEGVKDAFLDLAVYSVIALVLFEQEAED